MVRSSTSPAPGVGIALSSMRKSEALGSPTGRETRTTRLADGDMVVSSDFFIVIASVAKQSMIAKQRRWIASSQVLLAMTV
jgi:hypothetical protein